MENIVRQRIKDILKFKNISMTSFSRGDSALQLRLSRQLNRNSSISLDTISIILDRFPDVSAEWLLRGKGEMLKASAAADTNQISEVEAKRIKEGEGYLKLIKTQNEQIRLQQEQINTLIGLLDNKNYEN